MRVAGIPTPENEIGQNEESTYLHKATGLAAPGHSSISTGTILMEQKKIPESMNGGTVSGGRSCRHLFWNSWQLRS